MSDCSRKALVSVVIVSWNARNDLERCLDSLAVHGGRRALEIIVVDNDSADGSPELVVERYPHVRLIRSGSNLGFAKANNIGLAASSGDVLLLINSDVEVLPGCIDMLIGHLESDASIGMTGQSPRKRWTSPAILSQLPDVMEYDLPRTRTRHGARRIESLQWLFDALLEPDGDPSRRHPYRLLLGREAAGLQKTSGVDELFHSWGGHGLVQALLGEGLEAELPVDRASDPPRGRQFAKRANPVFPRKAESRSPILAQAPQFRCRRSRTS